MVSWSAPGWDRPGYQLVYYCIAVWGEKKHYCIAVLSVAILAQDPFWLEYLVARVFCTIWKLFWTVSLYHLNCVVWSMAPKAQYFNWIVLFIEWYFMISFGNCLMIVWWLFDDFLMIILWVLMVLILLIGVFMVV